MHDELRLVAPEIIVESNASYFVGKIHKSEYRKIDKDEIVQFCTIDNNTIGPFICQSRDCSHNE